MKPKYIIILFILLSALRLNANDALIDSASTAYSNGDYAKAISIYESILSSEGSSAALLADMGNAYVKSGDYGKGRLCYERSLLLSPGNKMARNNLKYIISKIEDNNKTEAKGKKVSVNQDAPSFFNSLKEWISIKHLPNTWASWAAVTFILFCVCVGLYIFIEDVMIRKIGFFGGITMLGISIVTLIFSFMSANAREHVEAGVITGYKVVLLTEPLSTSKASSLPLTRGTRLDILDYDEGKTSTEPGWYKVRLNSDYVGWIPSTEFEAI